MRYLGSSKKATRRKKTIRIRVKEAIRFRKIKIHPLLCSFENDTFKKQEIFINFT